jgi:hypothetical protein
MINEARKYQLAKERWQRKLMWRICKSSREQEIRKHQLAQKIWWIFVCGKMILEKGDDNAVNAINKCAEITRQSICDGFKWED